MRSMTKSPVALGREALKVAKAGLPCARQFVFSPFDKVYSTHAK